MKNEIYHLTEDREKQLWKKAVIVFDSSALLDFYFLPKDTRDQIFNELFGGKLKKRLWIPAHVKFEFYKNHEKVRLKPIEKKYEPIKNISLKNLVGNVEKLVRIINDIKENTNKSDYHPHIDQVEILSFEKKLDSFKKETSGFKDKISDLINKEIEKINDQSTDDDVSKAIQNHFSIGSEYDFQKLIQISKEGEHRYKFKIPPGYEDYQSGEKIGMQIFGDLIIWLQLIEYAKEINKSIIFVCNDTKEDWYRPNGGKTKNSPRHELIKEFHDSVKSEFWMYDLSQFLHKSNKYLDTTINDETIDQLSEEITDTRRMTGMFIFSCNNCSRHYLISELSIVENYLPISSLRFIGTRMMESSFPFLCDCKKHLDIKYRVTRNNNSISDVCLYEVNHGNVKKQLTFKVELGLLNTCIRCSNEFYDHQLTEICAECENYYIDN